MSKKKLKKQTNPVARELRTERFKNKIVPNKKRLSELKRTKVKI
tara:strand:+ start:1115 stop:1246 length:132 start_codon:yes stop_codon:yes gene_type:complete